MLILKQSTAITLKLGPFLDSLDGNTVEAGLAIAQADVRLSKNGGAFGPKNDANPGVYDEGGWYDIPLNATDTNTLGRLVIYVHEAGALQAWERAMVVPANVYDSLFGADNLQVDLIQWIGVAPLALQAQRVQTYVGAMANGVIAAATFAANALDSVWDALRAAHAGVGTFGEGVASVIGSVGSVVGNVGGNVVGSVASVVGNVGGNVVGTVASVVGSVGSVVGNVGGNVVGNVQGTVASVVGAVGSVAGNVVGSVGSVVGNVGGNVVGSVGSVLGNVVGSVGSVVGNVGGNVVGTVASVIGNVGGSVASMLAAGRNEIADSVLSRAISNTEAAAPFRSLTGAIAKLVNHVRVIGGNLVIYETDDATPYGTQALTTDAAADPITRADTV